MRWAPRRTGTLHAGPCRDGVVVTPASPSVAVFTGARRRVFTGAGGSQTGESLTGSNDGHRVPFAGAAAEALDRAAD